MGRALCQDEAACRREFAPRYSRMVNRARDQAAFSSSLELRHTIDVPIDQSLLALYAAGRDCSCPVHCTRPRSQRIATPSQAFGQRDLAAARPGQRQPIQRNRRAQQGAEAASASAPHRWTTQPAEIFANPTRAYPPSCLTMACRFRSFRQRQCDPAPHCKQTSTCSAIRPYSAAATAECKLHRSRYGHASGAWPARNGHIGDRTAVEIDRPAAKRRQHAPYPTIPACRCTQGSNTCQRPARRRSEYILLHDVPVNTAVCSSDIWVLENFYGQHDAVRLQPGVRADHRQLQHAIESHYDRSVPAYNTRAIRRGLAAVADQRLHEHQLVRSAAQRRRHADAGLRQRRRSDAYLHRRLVHVRPNRIAVLAVRARHDQYRRPHSHQRRQRTTRPTAASPETSAQPATFTQWGTIEFQFPGLATP